MNYSVQKVTLISSDNYQRILCLPSTSIKLIKINLGVYSTSKIQLKFINKFNWFSQQFSIRAKLN
jgi:hypothetical protein